MSFSKEWDNVYSTGAQIATWPWSDLVSYVHRYSPIRGGGTKVLEIGFGSGANIPFFLSMGVDYTGVEGSELMVNMVKNRFQILRENLLLGDFTEMDYAEGVDIVVDRSSMTLNDSESIARGLFKISKSMKQGGKYIGIDWFSLADSGAFLGDAVDKYTRCNITEGRYQGVGKVHFSDEHHLIELFRSAKMNIIKMEHKETREKIPNNKDIHATWNFVAEKK